MYFYQLDNSLKIKTNIKELFPKFFLTKEQLANCDLEVVLKKYRDIVFVKTEAEECFPGVFLNRKKKQVFSEFALGWFKFCIKVTFGEKITVETSQSYYLLSKFFLKMPVSAFYPLEHFVKMIMQIQLLNSSKSFLISAGITADNKSTSLISSFGGIGKTGTTLGILKKKKSWKLLGDDTLITDGNKVYAYPRQFRIRRFGPMLLSFNSHIFPEDYFGKDTIIRDSIPQRIFLLKRGSKNKLCKLDRAETFHLLKLIHDKILPIEFERILMAANLGKIINTKDLILKRDRILKELIDKAECYSVETCNGYRYSKLIIKWIDSHE